MKHIIKLLSAAIFTILLLASCSKPSVDTSTDTSLPSNQSSSILNNEILSANMDDADVNSLLQMIEESEYLSHSIVVLPEDSIIASQVVNKESFYIPNTIFILASWAKGVDPFISTLDANTLQIAAKDLFGVDNYNLENLYELPSEPGSYIYPAHGPMHYSELLKDTVTVSENTISLNSIVSYFNYGEGDYRTETLKHVFVKNPPNASIPYRVKSVTLIDQTGSLYADSVVPPTNIYENPVYGFVNVSNLNMRLGPGTEYESVFLMPEDSLVFIVGNEANGEWICTYNGWVKSEFVTMC